MILESRRHPLVTVEARANQHTKTGTQDGLIARQVLCDAATTLLVLNVDRHNRFAGTLGRY